MIPLIVVRIHALEPGTPKKAQVRPSGLGLFGLGEADAAERGSAPKRVGATRGGVDPGPRDLLIVLGDLHNRTGDRSIVLGIVLFAPGLARSFWGIAEWHRGALVRSRGWDSRDCGPRFPAIDARATRGRRRRATNVSTSDPPSSSSADPLRSVGFPPICVAVLRCSSSLSSSRTRRRASHGSQLGENPRSLSGSAL